MTQDTVNMIKTKLKLLNERIGSDFIDVSTHGLQLYRLHHEPIEVVHSSRILSWILELHRPLKRINSNKTAWHDIMIISNEAWNKLQ